MEGTGAPILVVEDDPYVRDAIVLTLEEEGLTSDTAANGQEALERVAEYRPALVVLDIGLPIVDGYDVADGLRAIYGEDAPPIVSVTAYGSTAKETLRLGAVSVLDKPFDIVELVDAVHHALDTPGRGHSGG